MAALVDQSLRVILAHQASTGAFLASPNLPVYRYAWLRDGAFCANAAQLHGEIDAARRFHDWVSDTVLRHWGKLVACVAAARRGERLPADACFHSRFTIDGAEVPGGWGHHQLDGLGTWLWALEHFAERHLKGALPPKWRTAADLAADYLAAMWRFPCSDWWEEGEHATHTSTLAAVSAGLAAHARLLGWRASSRAAKAVHETIRRRHVSALTFAKSSADPGVDASLLSLYVPYGIVRWDDEIYRATVARIVDELATPTGVHRYAGDSFYGGGEWVLLTAWLGWVYARAGELDRATAILAWIEAQADDEGCLPEQVPHALLAPDALPIWTERWGAVASPLLWSHAMYLILVDELSAGSTRGLSQGMKGGHRQ
jgi:GH15 family glucan-1,4-alpha-glucosidase